MMNDSTETLGEAVDFAITRGEAKLIREALKVLCNCRRYAFKDEHKGVDELYADLFTDAAKIEQRLSDALATD